MAIPSAIAKNPTDKPVATAAYWFRRADRRIATLNGSVAKVAPIAAPGASGISTLAERSHKIAANIPAMIDSALNDSSVTLT
jgi:hypothetical protein